MILVVEDSAVSREYLTNQLERRGYTSRGAGNLEDAIRKIREQPPEFILLDLMLPTEKEAIKVISEIVENPRTKETRVIVTTGVPGDDSIVWPRVVRIIHKPFTVEDVILLIDQFRQRSLSHET